MNFIFNLVLLSSLSAVSTAHAAPSIGETNFYEGTSGSAGQEIPYTIETVLASYDAGTDSYLQQATIHWGQSSPYHSRTIPAKEYITVEKATLLVKNCQTSENGVLETVHVKAGTFLACKKPRFDRPEQINWYAPVTGGGVVKVDWNNSQSGLHLQIELTSYKLAH